MNIDPKMIPVIWYEDADGNRFVPDLSLCGEDVPKRFIYQHSQFPTTIRHSILKIVQREEVDACEHSAEKVVRTDGWVDGIEGRECKACYGSQMKSVGTMWPEKWEAYGSRQLMAFECSWSEDLALSIANAGDWRLSDAILIAATACERCMNALAHRYRLTWGYPEGSDEWQRSRTTCRFCEAVEPISHGATPDAKFPCPDILLL